MAEIEAHVLKPEERFPRSGTLTLFFEAIFIAFFSFALLFGKFTIARGDQRAAALVLGFAAIYFIISALVLPKLKKLSVIHANALDFSANIIVLASFVYLTGGPTRSFAFPLLFVLAMFIPARVPFWWAASLNGFLAGTIALLYTLEVAGQGIFPAGQIFQALLYLAIISAFADAIGRDVTNSFASYFTKAAEVKKLEEVNRLKDEFTFIAAHELRSPVTAIRGYASMFQSGDFGQLSAQADHAITVIREAVERLNALVDDLLDVSRIEARRLRLTIEVLDATSIVTAICDALRAKAITFSHTLTCKLDEEHLYIKADQIRIKEVLTNLVDNAIKYTPRGGIIDVAVRTKKDLVEIKVRDNGLGIPEEAKAHIFERFYRVPRKGSEIEGTGLGLFITKHLIENMGGQISFESETGKGTTFTFTVPRSQTPPPLPSAPYIPGASAK